MTATTWDVVVDGLQRLESPCIDLDGNLCFSDIAGDGAIYRLGSDDTLEMISTRRNVGGLVPHAAGGLVATGPTVVVIDNKGKRTVMEPEGGWGFNDFATDASGNLFVGMHAEPPKATPPAVEASAWRIGTDAVIKALLRRNPAHQWYGALPRRQPALPQRYVARAGVGE
jgi:sugar lactone lactonase YvrE